MAEPDSNKHKDVDVHLSLEALMYMAAGKDTDYDDAVYDALKKLLADRKTLVGVVEEYINIIDLISELTRDPVSDEIVQKLAGLYASIEKMFSDADDH